MKQRSIKLAHCRGSYTVIVVKNSTLYHPGLVLSRSEVDDLCRNGAWEVVVVGSNKEEERK